MIQMSLLFFWLPVTLGCRIGNASVPIPLVKPCSVPGMGFCNISLSAAERAADLVARLNTTEKFLQLSTYSFAKPYCHRFTPSVPRIGLPSYTYHTEGLHGMRDTYMGGLNGTLYPQVCSICTRILQVEFN